jgi:hydrogenase expression/formation protein HypC
MCLGVPARLLEIVDAGSLGRVDIGGAPEEVSLVLLEGQPLEPGDWVLVHMGFAMDRMTEEEARDALGALVTIGPGEDSFDDADFAAWGMSAGVVA